MSESKHIFTAYSNELQALNGLISCIGSKAGASNYAVVTPDDTAAEKGDTQA